MSIARMILRLPLPIRLVPCVLLAWLVLLPMPARALFHSPHDAIEAWAISPDFARDRTLFVSLPRFNLVLRTRDAGASFEVVNAGLDTAYVLGLAVSPDFAHDRTLFCAEIAHVFVSHDAGDQWEALPLPEQVRNVRGLAVSPDYAADGTLAAYTASDGLWLSRDRGATWTRLALPGEAAAPSIEGFVFSSEFSRDRRAWVLSGGTRLLASTDGAASFAVVAAPPGGGLQTLVADIPGRTLWVGTRAHGVLRSSDGGSTWVSDTGAAAVWNVLQLTLARDARGEAVLFAATADDGIAVKAGGAPWRINRKGFREPTDQTTLHYHGALPSPDFAHDHIVYAATFEGLYVSLTGGDGWQWIDVLHARIVRNLALSPGFAEDGTLWLSTYGLGLLEARPVEGADVVSAGAPVPPRTVLGEASGLRYRALDTIGWKFPDGIATSPAVATDHTLMVGAPNRLLLSTDGGASVRATLDSRKGFARALAFAPDFPDSGVAFAYLSTYTGTSPLANRFTRSADRGVTWQDTNIAAVDDMAFAPDWETSGRMYVACPDGLWTSDDRGLSFTRIESLDAKGCASVAVAPGSAGDILLVCSLFSGLHLSRDGGATWTPLSGGLGSTRFDYVEISPDFEHDGTAFAGPRTAGVYVTRDGGATWSRSEGGARVVLCMDRSPTYAADHTLLVGSYDGAWISRDAARSWTRLEIPLPPDYKPTYSK